MPSLKERMALLNRGGGIMLGGLKPGGGLPPKLRKKQEQRSKTKTLAPVNHPELDKPVINVRRKSRTFGRRSLIVSPTNSNEKSQPLQRKSWSFSPTVSKNTKNKNKPKSKKEPTKVPKMKITPPTIVVQKLKPKPDPKPKIQPKLEPKIVQPKSKPSPQLKYNTPSKKSSQLTSTPKTKPLKEIKDPKNNNKSIIKIEKPLVDNDNNKNNNKNDKKDKNNQNNSFRKIEKENTKVENNQNTYSNKALKLNKKRDSQTCIKSSNHKNLMDFIFAQSKENKQILLNVMSTPKLNKILQTTFDDVKKCKFKNDIDENNAWIHIISRWKKYV